MCASWLVALNRRRGGAPCIRALRPSPLITAKTGLRSSSRPGDQPKTPVPRDQHVRRTFVGGLLGRTTLAPSRASRGLCVCFGQLRLVIGEGALERLLDAWSDRPKTTRIVAAGAPHSIDAADRRHRFDARAAQVTEIGTDWEHRTAGAPAGVMREWHRLVQHWAAHAAISHASQGRPYLGFVSPL
jgi:hypothetical protein